MKRVVFLILVTSMSIGSLTECISSSQNNSKLFTEPQVNYDKQEYYAYIMNSMNIWKEIILKEERDAENSLNDTVGLFRLARSYHGLLLACIGNQDKETFDAHIKNADAVMKQLIKLTPRWSKVYALQSGIISSKLAFEPSKGMTLGPKNQKTIQKAFKLNENEPIAWMQQGGNKLHTPEKFGGSVPKSIEAYLKAVEIFETDSSLLLNNWHYLNTVTWLGIAYERNGDYSAAVQTFEKALKFEPDFGWVKYNLLPSAKEKLSLSKE